MLRNRVFGQHAKSRLSKNNMEAASEVGVKRAEGYNLDLTSRNGQMIKKMVEEYENGLL